MEVKGEGGRLYTYRYTVTTRMIPALRSVLILQEVNMVLNVHRNHKAY